MNRFLSKGKRCPLHQSLYCACHGPVKKPSSSVRKRPQQLQQTRRFAVAVLKVPDESIPRGYRERCSAQEKQRRKDIHIGKQEGICPLCLKKFENYRDVEFCHKYSGKFGGSATDDHMDVTFAGHRWCNREQGSRPFEEGMCA